MAAEEIRTMQTSNRTPMTIDEMITQLEYLKGVLPRGGDPSLRARVAAQTSGGPPRPRGPPLLSRLLQKGEAPNTLTAGPRSAGEPIAPVAWPAQPAVDPEGRSVSLRTSVRPSVDRRASRRAMLRLASHHAPLD